MTLPTNPLQGIIQFFTHRHEWSAWSDVVPNVMKKKLVMGRWRTCQSEGCGKREFKKSAIVQPKPL